MIRLPLVLSTCAGACALGLMGLLVGCVDPFGDYHGTAGAPLILPDQDGGTDAATTGTILGSGSGYGCSATVQVGFLSPQTCAIPDAVSSQVGFLEWTCGGGGAQLSLGSTLLSGTVTGTEIAVSGTSPDPADPATYDQTVTVTGDLTTYQGTLWYEITAIASLPGQQAACEASAPVTLQ